MAFRIALLLSDQIPSEGLFQEHRPSMAFVIILMFLVVVLLAKPSTKRILGYPTRWFRCCLCVFIFIGSLLTLFPKVPFHSFLMSLLMFEGILLIFLAVPVFSPCERLCTHLYMQWFPFFLNFSYFLMLKSVCFLPGVSHAYGAKSMGFSSSFDAQRLHYPSRLLTIAF